MKDEVLVTILIVTALNLSVAFLYVIKINKIEHDVVYGKVKIRDKVFQCKPWEYTKEKRNALRK